MYIHILFNSQYFPVVTSFVVPANNFCLWFLLGCIFRQPAQPQPFIGKVLLQPGATQQISFELSRWTLGLGAAKHQE